MMKHVHFIGICGSGAAGAAGVAASKGFKVSGCDKKESSQYTCAFGNLDIKVYEGQDVSHLEGVDIVATSPAFLYKDKFKEIPEMLEAHNKGILIKWQEFLGRYVFNGRQTIAVCGTHGKTTTTTLLGLALEQAGIDPTVLVGGIVPNWGQTFRNGNSDYYVIEADEYDNNFIHYNPKYVLLNNLEMEHPEVFDSFEEYKKVFTDFLKTMQTNGAVIANLDSKNVCSALKELRAEFETKNIKIIGYTIYGSEFECDRVYKVRNVALGEVISFEVDGKYLQANVIGLHNVYNISSVYALCQTIGADRLNLQKVLEAFSGAGRRLETVLDNRQIRLYNDYAHHHSQIKVNLEALKAAFPKNKIVAVLEPHQISRLAQNWQEYMEALSLADRFFVAKIFEGREKGKALPDVKAMLRYFPKGEYLPDSDELIKAVIKEIEPKTIVIVMGAGESYIIADELREKFDG